jgi:hypothetical protein
MGLVRVLEKGQHQLLVGGIMTALPPHWRAVQTVLHLPLRMFAISILDRPRLAHATLLCSERALEHVFEVEFRRLSIPNHRTSEL